MTLEEFFAGFEASRPIFDSLLARVERLGSVDVRVGRSQVAFARKRAFAWAWVPARYLRGSQVAPLILSVSLRRRDDSPRWKQIVEPVPGRFMHHLELREPSDLDEEVEGWLRDASRRPDRMDRMTPRLDRERRTIAVMVGIYCAGRHDLRAASLCPDCSGLVDYAMARVDRCPFIEDKPTCARCPVHCYRAAERARVREVMRYAGPRMVYRHPLLTVRHYLDQLRHRPKPRGRSDARA